MESPVSSEETMSDDVVSPGRVIIELSELSSKKRNAVLGLIKDMGFTPEEIREVVVRLPGHNSGSADGVTAL